MSGINHSFQIILCMMIGCLFVGEVAAGLLHSLRAKREEDTIADVPKQKDISKVGSRISSKFKSLYSTDEEDTGGLFYQPPKKNKSEPKRLEP